MCVYCRINGEPESHHFRSKDFLKKEETKETVILSPKDRKRVDFAMDAYCQSCVKNETCNKNEGYCEPYLKFKGLIELSMPSAMHVEPLTPMKINLYFYNENETFTEIDANCDICIVKNLESSTSLFSVYYVDYIKFKTDNQSFKDFIVSYRKKLKEFQDNSNIGKNYFINKFAFDCKITGLPPYVQVECHQGEFYIESHDDDAIIVYEPLDTIFTY